MLGKRILACVLVLGLTSSAVAANSTALAPSFGSVVVKAIPNAAGEALTSDLFVVGGLIAAVKIGFIKGIPPQILIPYTVGAFASQMVRSTCKHYVSDGQPSVVCGLVAGATKYGTRSELLTFAGKDFAITGNELAIKAVRGAADIGQYELHRKSLIEAIVGGDVATAAMIIYQTEIFNYLFEIGIAVYTAQQVTADANALKTALLVPTLIVTSIYTTSAYLGDPVKASIASGIDMISNAIYGTPEEKTDL